MAGVLVVEPGGRVVAVQDSKSGHPVLLAAVAPPPRHQASDHCRRPHVKLQPLVDCGPQTCTVLNTLDFCNIKKT